MSSIKGIGRYIGAQVVINITTRKQGRKGRVSGTISKHVVIVGRVNVFIDWAASFFLFLETKLVD